MGREFPFWNKIFIIKYCQYTMTASWSSCRLEIKQTVNSYWFWVAMWAKHKQSEIQMVKRNSPSLSSKNCLHWWGEKFASWNKKKYYKMPPVYHDCKPNDQENSHKLQIRTAFSKNRKVNFCLKMKLAVNSSWFRVAMWAKHKQSQIQNGQEN